METGECSDCPQRQCPGRRKMKGVEKYFLLPREEPCSRNTYAGSGLWQSWHLKIGGWAGLVPELQYQTVVMSRQVLGYHSRKQKHEKRVGRYITLLYRINAYKHAEKGKVSMGVLLEQAGILPDLDHPGRTQEAIESALEQLRVDGVIGQFTPVAENSPRAGHQAAYVSLVG